MPGERSCGSPAWTRRGWLRWRFAALRLRLTHFTPKMPEPLDRFSLSLGGFTRSWMRRFRPTVEGRRHRRRFRSATWASTSIARCRTCAWSFSSSTARVFDQRLSIFEECARDTDARHHVRRETTLQHQRVRRKAGLRLYTYNAAWHWWFLRRSRATSSASAWAPPTTT